MLSRFVFLLLILLGFLLVFFNDRVFREYERYTSKDNREVLAKVDSLQGGGARHKLPRSLRFRDAYEGMDLKDQDTLTTDGQTTMKVSFVSGFEVEVQPNSLLVIEEPEETEDGGFQVTFLRGNFKVLKEGQGKVVVRKRALAVKENVEPAPVTIAAIPIVKPKPPPPKKDVLESVKVEEIVAKPIKKTKPKKAIKRKKEGLPDAYVASIIKRQKSFFNRCYAQHLRVNPNAKGRINFAFTIEPTGKVSSVNVVNATIPDPRLQQCTMSVISRVTFRTFDGDPIVINYPINFE